MGSVGSADTNVLQQAQDEQGWEVIPQTEVRLRLNLRTFGTRRSSCLLRGKYCGRTLPGAQRGACEPTP